MKRRPKQTSFLHGGPREPGRGRKLGRPPGPRPCVPRVPRADVSGRDPLHVTLRVRSDIDLRDFPEHEVLKAAMNAGRMRFGFRLVHYSVQRDHFHLLVEAVNKRALTRGMQGLEIRIAKALNFLRYERGARWLDPYSSSTYFDGWKDGPPETDPIDADAPVVGPSTWLLRVGWRKWHGPIPVDEIPGGRS